MPVFSGNTATSAASTAYDIPSFIKSFNITNKSGGAITVNASILFGSTNVWITPLNHPLAANEYLGIDRKILVPRGAQIYVLVSGSADYYFTIE